MLQRSNKVALPPRQEPRRLRKALARKVAAIAARKNQIQLGLVISWGYNFLLRINSELIKQGNWRTMTHQSQGPKLGPILRKDRKVTVVLERQCLCNTQHSILCPDAWLRARWDEVGRNKDIPVFDLKIWELRNQFHAALQEAGVDPEEIPLWGFHSIRRGAGVDLLQKRSIRPSTGADQMLREGDWISPKSSLHYVTAEEFEQAIMEDSAEEEED